MNHPKHTQDMGAADFRIDKGGQWFHDDAPIGRKALAKLFSDRALKRDAEGQYWLQTPFEKYPVAVEDVPYIIVDYTAEGGAIDFVTNMEDVVALGPDNPLELRDFEGQKLPYIAVRDGLYARLGRNVFHELVQHFGAHIESRGATFALGEMVE